MSAAKHTPGPWVKRSGILTGADGSYVVADSLGLGLGSDGGDGVSTANARLIAAAPDLLQELVNIANADTAEWDDRSEFEAWAKNRARAAIRKATGAA